MKSECLAQLSHAGVFTHKTANEAYVMKKSSLLPHSVAEDQHMATAYPDVPEDFLRLIKDEVLCGAKSPTRRVQYNDEYFVRGCSPPEIYRRWDRCEDLAYKYVLKAFRMKQRKCSNQSEAEILENIFARLCRGRHGTTDEMKWVMRRMAGLLKWPVPNDVDK